MTLQAKIIALAVTDATLQSYLGNGPTIGVTGFRWFDKQLVQGAINVGPCVRMTSLGDKSLYEQAGLNPTGAELMQFDVWVSRAISGSAELARTIAAALIAWFERVDFSAGSSGQVSAVHHPNFKVSQGSSLAPQLSVIADYERLDYRIWNLN